MYRNSQINPVMTLTEVSRYLKVSEKTIQRMLQEGEIPGFKVSSQWRFHREDLERWLAGKRGGGIPGPDRAVSPGPAPAEHVPLDSLTGPEWVLAGVPSMRCEDLLVEMADRLVQNGYLGDVADFVDGLLDRERMASTAIGGGVAIPHLRHPGRFPIHRPLLMAATCPEGIEWNAFDGEKVRLVLLPVSGSEETHLRILSSVAAYLRRHEGLVDRLVSAPTPEQVIGILYEKG